MRLRQGLGKRVQLIKKPCNRILRILLKTSILTNLNGKPDMFYVDVRLVLMVNVNWSNELHVFEDIQAVSAYSLKVTT